MVIESVIPAKAGIHGLETLLNDGFQTKARNYPQDLLEYQTGLPYLE
jgi:hypothetical protein